MPKTLDDIIKALQAHTPPREVRYLPQGIDKERGTALALAYVDARFVQDRLDAACGPFGWQSLIQDIGGFVCVGIAVLNPETSEWIWKWDTGQDEPTDETDYDDKSDAVTVAGKSIVSRGIKRAGVQWGIARDLYDIPKRRRAIRLNAGGKFAGWDATRDGDGNGNGHTEAGATGQGKTEAQGDGQPEGDGTGTGGQAQATSTVKAEGGVKYAPEYLEFMDIAKRLEWDRTAINNVAQSCKDPQSGRVDYARARDLAKKQLPPTTA